MTKKKQPEGSVDLVKSRCVLVMFNAGYYNWKRRDRSTERELAESKGVRRETWETKKNIFVGADALLAQAKSLVNESRAYHYDVTLPWTHGKSAVLANGLVPPYRERLAQFQNRMDAINDQIKTEWKSMILNAKATLGPAFNHGDYPDVAEVLKANYIEAHYAPVGSGADIRSTLDGATDSALDDIREEINADTRRAYDAAIHALWERLYDVLKTANKNLQKLNSDDGRFRTEWYDNLSSLLPILDDLNLSDDPRISEVRAEAEKLLKYSPDVLKDDVDVRERLAEDADKIFEKVSGIFTAMGGDD
jgi:hypothetical protein